MKARSCKVRGGVMSKADELRKKLKGALPMEREFLLQEAERDYGKGFADVLRASLKGFLSSPARAPKKGGTS